MAKQAYKIPASIDRSRLDLEITIESERAGVRLPPIPTKVLLYWFVVIGVLLWVVMQSPLSNASLGWIVLFSFWFILAGVFFGRRLKTKEFVWSQLPALVNYLSPENRKVITRRSSEPYGLMWLIGIRDVDPNGLIYFLDGSLGRMYNVVGSASALLFNEDRAAIIDRVDNFWRKVDTDSEWIIFDGQEPQRVSSQVSSLYDRQNKLVSEGKLDESMYALLSEQYEILVDQVGGKFNSIHQYVLIKSPTAAALQSSHDVLAGEVRDSSRMFKHCTILDDKRTYTALGSLFGSYAVREREDMRFGKSKKRKKKRKKASA